jgi:energy-converting hydrogenase Eha subunit G
VTDVVADVGAAVTGAYGIALGTILAVALIVSGLAYRVRTTRQGGQPMTDRQRWRLLAGLACLVLAALVGIVGYLKLSLEPAVNRQIPYMASAGMALVLLSAIGGSLLVAEQLRTDDRRIEELEEAVRSLASAMGPAIEAPARKKG